MTMPVIIKKIRNKALETQFKTAHSLVSQAVLQMSNETPNLNAEYCRSDAHDSVSHRFIQDFAKYFQLVKYDFGDTMVLTKYGYPDSYFYRADKEKLSFNGDGYNDGAIFLKNGVMIASSGCWWGSSKVDFVVDTNGVKGPNKFGYDVFYFQIGNDNKLLPDSGNYIFAENEDIQRGCCNFNQSQCPQVGNNGATCAQFALTDVSPHDNTKKYWNSLP